VNGIPTHKYLFADWMDGRNASVLYPKGLERLHVERRKCLFEGLVCRKHVGHVIREGGRADICEEKGGENNSHRALQLLLQAVCGAYALALRGGEGLVPSGPEGIFK